MSKIVVKVDKPIKAGKPAQTENGARSRKESQQERGDYAGSEKTPSLGSLVLCCARQAE